MNTTDYKRMLELEALNDAKPLHREAMAELWMLRYAWWDLPDMKRFALANEGEADASS